MSPLRPYLVRSFYEWITDNLLTPFIIVNAESEGVDVPEEHVENGKIILNIAPQAVQNLKITNQILEFDASFSGHLHHIYMPIKAIEAIYAKENGRGMAFNKEDEEEGSAAPPPLKAGKPNLKIVK